MNIKTVVLRGTMALREVNTIAIQSSCVKILILPLAYSPSFPAPQKLGSGCISINRVRMNTLDGLRQLNTSYSTATPPNPANTAENNKHNPWRIRLGAPRGKRKQ